MSASIYFRLAGSVTDAADDLWKAENLAIEHRSAVGADLVWKITSAKMDIDALRRELLTMAEERREVAS